MRTCKKQCLVRYAQESFNYQGCLGAITMTILIRARPTVYLYFRLHHVILCTINDNSVFFMFILQDWRNEAQRIREDLDTGVTELQKNCQKCNKSFVREKDLRYHEKSCGNSTCKECGAVCKDFVQLRSHMAMEHSKEYSCETCKKCFPSKRNLERHKVRHTGEKVTCNICGIQFATKSNRKRHITKQH